MYAQGRRAIRGGNAGRTNGGVKKCRRHISDQYWRKLRGKPGGGDGVRGSHIRVKGKQRGRASRNLYMLGQVWTIPRWVYDPVSRL